MINFDRREFYSKEATTSHIRYLRKSCCCCCCVVVLLLRCLIEAHRSHIDTVLGVSVVDLAWCEVNDWESDVFVLVELKDC